MKDEMIDRYRKQGSGSHPSLTLNLVSVWRGGGVVLTEVILPVRLTLRCISGVHTTMAWHSFAWRGQGLSSTLSASLTSNSFIALSNLVNHSKSIQAAIKILISSSRA